MTRTGPVRYRVAGAVLAWCCTALLLGLSCGCGRPDYRRDYFQQVILERWDLINRICLHLQQDPLIYACVVYGELYCNFDHLDQYDDLRAAAGFNPSLGFAQMRLSTVEWIEETFAEELQITPSRHRSERIQRTRDDSTNIAYSVFYLLRIRQVLRDSLGYDPTVQQVGSWYARGIDRDILKIEADYCNPVGLMAAEAFLDRIFSGH
jgi:hypothetical protein